MKSKKKTRPAYAISLDDNEYYESSKDGELYLFDNYDQIAEFAVANDISFERISVKEFEVYDEPTFDVSDVPEIEF